MAAKKPVEAARGVIGLFRPPKPVNGSTGLCGALSGPYGLLRVLGSDGPELALHGPFFGRALPEPGRRWSIRRLALEE